MRVDELLDDSSEAESKSVRRVCEELHAWGRAQREVDAVDQSVPACHQKQGARSSITVLDALETRI